MYVPYRERNGDVGPQVCKKGYVDGEVVCTVQQGYSGH